MKITHTNIAYEETNSFSTLVLDYLKRDNRLFPFIEAFPSVEEIAHQIAKKEKQSIDRLLLQKQIKHQYADLSVNSTLSENIQLLTEKNTYTICTAHQPVIFGGPMYFMYKIVHAIRLSEFCNKRLPEFKFVPVFVMGSEDHDLEEIGQVWMNNKNYQWQTTQKGACGRMVVDDMAPILHELLRTLNEEIPDEKFLAETLRLAYANGNSLSKATRILLHAIFGQHGLIVLDGDDEQLKYSAKEIFRKELFQQQSKALVEETVASFPDTYNMQATPRDINLFYLKNDLRERIIQVEDNWEVMNTSIRFTPQQLDEEIESFPYHFSPNVILRPVYQESILPNIAFIGGGGELAYWLELKKVFQHNQVPYPLLFLRNSVLWLNHQTISKIKQLSLSYAAFFVDPDIQIRKMLNQDNRMIELETLLDQIHKTYASMSEMATQIAPQLAISIKAHEAKSRRIEKRIAEKFRTHIKRKELEIYGQIQTVHDQVFPNGILQERILNFLPLFKIHGMSMFQALLALQDPFNHAFLIIQDETE